MDQRSDPSNADQTDTFVPKLRWDNTIMITAIHLGCIAAPFTYTKSGLWVAIIMALVSTWIGISLGFHRLLTHMSFQTYPIIRYVLTICGCMACQNGPFEWVGVHRWHHGYTDKHPKDPHTPRNGLFWCHMAWNYYTPHLDYTPTCRDMAKDPVMVAINRYWMWIPASVAVLLFALGYAYGGVELGLSWLVWGVFVRTTYTYQLSWCVNSVTHRWGYRNFETDDLSTNSFLIGILAFGEGWHNNHHAQPRSAAHGMMPWEFDLSWTFIRLGEKLGLVWNVVYPKLPGASDQPK